MSFVIWFDNQTGPQGLVYLLIMQLLRGRTSFWGVDKRKDERNEST